MLESLTNRLQNVFQKLRGQTRLSEESISETLREVRLALLEADVALPIVKSFIEKMKVALAGKDVLKSLTSTQTIIQTVHEQLIELMGKENHALNLAIRPPAVLLLVGLQGSGKTTTSAKLARFLKIQHKKKVLLTSADIYRPAAIQQLEVLAQKAEVDFFKVTTKQKPTEIAKQSLEHAKKYNFDVLIFDTAGRLSIDDEMMKELAVLHELLSPIETLFVADAMQGQSASKVALSFHQTLPLTGVILTKMDGDARGGAALSIHQTVGQAIKFIGTSEKIDGLSPFYPDRLAGRILGMGDMLSLIEEVKQKTNLDEVKKLEKRVRSGQMDMNDFKGQMVQMRNMGGLSSWLDKLPTQIIGDSKKIDPEQGNKMMRRVEGIIDAMTPFERSNPEIIKASRKLRIAKGAGVQVQDVNRLLKQFEEAQKMMKIFSKGKMRQMAQDFLKTLR